MKHRACHAAALAALLIGAGCGMMQRSQAPAQAPAPEPVETVVSASPVIDRIVKRGELRVGTSGSQPPLTATTKDGSIIGFDADVARAFAKAMGVRLTLVPIQFSELLPSLVNGDVDMVLSGLTMTPQRNLQVAFVGPYLVSGMSILTKERTRARLRRAEDIDTPKVSLAALRGSTAVKFAEENVPRAKLALTDTLDEGVELVRKGKVDALLADHPFCMVTVYRYASDHFATLDTPFNLEPLGIALPPNDPLLVNWTENALAELEDTGVVLDTMSAWFEDDSWVEQLR
jgi:polar amino acid transport system substrate-binding protein